LVSANTAPGIAPLSYLLHNNLFIGMCAVHGCLETNTLLHIPSNNTNFYLLFFAATVFAYTLHYSLKKNPGIHSRAQWYKNHFYSARFTALISGLLTLVLSIAYFVQHRNSYGYPDILTFKIAAIAVLFVTAYSFPIIPTPKGRIRLRDIGWLKPFALAFAWTMLTTLIPLLMQAPRLTQPPEWMAVAKVGCMKFPYIAVLCILFDCRDYLTDKAAGLKTIPVLIGATNTIRYLLFPLTLLCLLLHIMLGYELLHSIPALLLTCLPGREAITITC
jgi:1,4-dihydroxy-2-naphthoate octaprenyltransferase